MRSEDLCFTAVLTILYDQDSVRISPVVLAAECSTPPVALPHIWRTHAPTRPPAAFFQRVPRTVRAHVRQCDPSLSFEWHGDPSQEVRDLVQDQSHDALPILVLLLHLAVAFSQLRTRSRVELVSYQQVRPVARFSRLKRVTHRSAIEPHASYDLLARARAPPPASSPVLPTAPLFLTANRSHIRWMNASDLKAADILPRETFHLTISFQTALDTFVSPLSVSLWS